MTERAIARLFCGHGAVRFLGFFLGGGGHLSLSRHGGTAMDGQLGRGVRRGRDYTDQMLTIIQMSPLHAQYVMLQESGSEIFGME